MDDNLPSINPYNDQPTVRLLDRQGAELGVLSQRAAAKLLRLGQAELLLVSSPAVRLLISTSDYETACQDPGSEETLKAQYLHARRGALYGNFHFQNPQGQTMFHGDSEKALWYLNRGLVEVVSHDPPVLRFRFIPGGTGHIGDPFYLSGKQNRCVVCGSEEGLNRHHVIPSVYRRHLPAEVKDHSHHDVLLLCLNCHEKYERMADQLKAELGAEVGVPLHGLRGERDRDRMRAVKLAHALVRHGTTIPPARQDEMRQQIAGWLGRESLTDEDIREVAGLATDDGEWIEHGERVVAAAGDVQAFLRRWRQHFMQTMQPRFLPDHWEVDRPAVRQE